VGSVIIAGSIRHRVPDWVWGKNAEDFIKCHKFHTVRTKNFSSVAISEGDISPLSP